MIFNDDRLRFRDMLPESERENFDDYLTEVEEDAEQAGYDQALNDLRQAIGRLRERINYLEAGGSWQVEAKDRESFIAGLKDALAVLE